MKFLDISKDIRTSKPYPGDPETNVQWIMRTDNNDECNLSSVSFSSHIGTHIDAPFHYLSNGTTIDKMDLSIFYGECTVVTVEGILTGEDMDKLLPYCKKRVLFNGYGKTFISSSAVEVLKNHGILLVGTDSPSIAPDYENEKVHKLLLNADIAILENAELKNVKDGVYILSAFPLKISSGEAAPCRAILIAGEKMFWF